MGDGEGLDKKSFEPEAGGRRRSEGLTLVFAVAVAVTLGVACGIWINARLTPRVSADAARTARPLPDARASVPPAPTATAVQTPPCDGCETSLLGEATPARTPSDKADEELTKTETVATPDAARAASPEVSVEPRRTDEVAAVKVETHGASSPSPVATASPEPSRPVAWQVGAVPRAATRGNSDESAADDVGQSQTGPCTLYASASVLHISAGGAAPLILGGPGAGVRINVSTPDWKELAVIYEGPAAGHNGWLKYSVKSVGRRPGLYTVLFSTPCGSQTIPVTVK